MKIISNSIVTILFIMPAICEAQIPKTDKAEKTKTEISQFTRENYNIDRDFNSEAKATQPEPTPTTVQFSQEAQQAAAANDFNPAIGELGVLIEANPNHVFALTNRANLYLKTRQPDKALADAKRALKLNGKNFNAVFIAGSALILMGKPSLAVKYFDTALVLKPDWLQALQYRGKLFVQTGQNAEAIEDLTKVIEMEPENPMSYLLRARAHYRKYMINESLMDYIVVIDMAPKESKLYQVAREEFKMPQLEYEEREAFMKEAAKKAAAAGPDPRFALKRNYFEKIHGLNSEATTLAFDVNTGRQSGYQSELDKARKSFLNNLNKQQELSSGTLKELKRINNADDKLMMEMLENVYESNKKTIAKVNEMKVVVIEPSRPTYVYDYDEYDYWGY